MNTAPAPTAAGRRAFLRAALLVFACYLALAALITWPLLTVIGTHFAGYANGDAHEMTRHIWWFRHALQTGQPLFFQPLLGYPDGIEGVILWSNPLQFFPAWLLAFALPLPAAYNLAALLNLALNGAAACFLVSSLTRDRGAALLGGALFMASPALQGHLAGGHGGLLAQWPLPLLAWALERSLAASRQPEAGSWRVERLTLLFLVLLPLGHTLQLIYAGLPLVGLFALALLAERRWRSLGRLALALGVGGALLLVFLLPVAGATLGTGAYTGEDGSVTYSLDALAVVTPSFNHPLFGAWPVTPRVLGTNIVEGSAYIGIVAGLLGALAIWRRRESRAWLAVALVAWGLALGPLLKVFDTPVAFTTDGYETHITLPWALLQDLPIFNLARTPGRFNFLLALAVAVLAGYGWAAASRALAGKTRRLALGAALVIGLALFEYQSFWPLPTYPADVPQAVRALRERDDVRAVFDVPWDNVLAAKDALWLQTAHEKPLVAGQVTRRTPVDPAKLALLQAAFDPALLDAAGADVVIVHQLYDDALAARARAALGEPFYQDDRLALYDVPAPESAPAFAGLPATRAARDAPERPLEVTAQTPSYAYAPFPGWALLQGTLGAAERDLHVLLDGQAVHRLPAGEAADRPFSLWLPLADAGYHTVALAVEPPCPPRYNRETLACRSVPVSTLAFADFGPARFVPARFERGVTLAGALMIPATAGTPPTLRAVELALWWQFEEPRTEQDVRFIKVLDANGAQVAGLDETLGSQTGGSQRVENLRLGLPDGLLPGVYDVFAGWYSYPDVARFAVLAEGPRAAEGLAFVGSLTLP